MFVAAHVGDRPKTSNNENARQESYFCFPADLVLSGEIQHILPLEDAVDFEFLFSERFISVNSVLTICNALGLKMVTVRYCLLCSSRVQT